MKQRVRLGLTLLGAAIGAAVFGISLAASSVVTCILGAATAILGIVLFVLLIKKDHRSD